MGTPEHQWRTLHFSRGMEWCVDCGAERCMYRMGWAYKVAAPTGTRPTWIEPPCGAVCQACLAKERAEGDGCEACKGAGILPRAQNEQAKRGGG